MPDAAKFRRKMRAMKTVVKEQLAKAVERQAEAVTKEMRAFLLIGYPAVAAKTDIGWTWGEDLPRGAIRVGEFRGKETAELTVVIYATAKQGSGFNVRWFEAGTRSRQTKTGANRGQIQARPFFYSVYRANKQRVLNNLRATLRRAVKKVNSM